MDWMTAQRAARTSSSTSCQSAAASADCKTLLVLSMTRMSAGAAATTQTFTFYFKTIPHGRFHELKTGNARVESHPSDLSRHRRDGDWGSGTGERPKTFRRFWRTIATAERYVTQRAVDDSTHLMSWWWLISSSDKGRLRQQKELTRRNYQRGQPIHALSDLKTL